MVPRRWDVPEGLAVLPDGSWRVGGQPVVHASTLRHLKAHLVLAEDGAWVVDGPQRLPVRLEGPPLVVTTLVVDESRGQVLAVLDDGTEEVVRDAALGMNADTGRFECAVRGGVGRAVLSRGAHQTLLEHVEEDHGGFVLRAGERRLAVRA
jgi:hypothetical protein